MITHLVNKIVRMEDKPGTDTLSTAKFVIIGDGSVGKTCVCNTYANKKFPEEYVPTIFENHNSKHIFGGEVCLLSHTTIASITSHPRKYPSVCGILPARRNSKKSGCRGRNQEIH